MKTHHETASSERALLVGVGWKRSPRFPGMPAGEPERESLAELVELARSAGITKFRGASARNRMAEYIEHNFVQKDGDKYYVTDHAASRFGFPHAVTATNEAPVANTKGAS